MSLELKQKLPLLLPILIISLISVVSTHFVYHLTKNQIHENKQRATLAIINDVITADYNNDPFIDHIDITIPADINPTKTLSVFRARHDKEPVAVALMPVIAKGYNDDISLVIGIEYDGTVTGIRVLQEDETEGFGDRVHQDKSDWLLGFNKQSINEIPKKDWSIQKDGGKFDQLSGATITSRSVTTILFKTLQYYIENRELFYGNQ